MLVGEGATGSRGNLTKGVERPRFAACGAAMQGKAIEAFEIMVGTIIFINYLIIYAMKDDL